MEPSRTRRPAPTMTSGPRSVPPRPAGGWTPGRYGPARPGPGSAAQPPHALGVQPVGRLVQHQDAGVAEELLRPGVPLSHAQGVAAARRPPASGQVDQSRTSSARDSGRPPPGSRRAGGCDRSDPGGTPFPARPRPSAAGWGGWRRGRRRRPPSRASGCMRPRSIRSVAVLPAPFGPRKPVTEPGSTVKPRSETACTSPNDLPVRGPRPVPGRPSRWLVLEMVSPRHERRIRLSTAPGGRLQERPDAGRAARRTTGVISRPAAHGHIESAP